MKKIAFLFLIIFSHFYFSQLGDTLNAQLIFCDIDHDGETINLSDYTEKISLNPNYIFKFYTTNADASADVNAINPIQFILADTTFFVRVTDPETGNFTINLLMVTFSEEGCENLIVKDPPLSRINVYPNPARDFITIESFQKIDKVEIFAVSGNKLSTFNTQKIDVSNLEKGIYILKIYLSEKVYTSKFLKQ